MGNESQKSRVEGAVYQVKRLCTIPRGRKRNKSFFNLGKSVGTHPATMDSYYFWG